MTRRPLKTESLLKLREMSVPIKSVIDVGVMNGTWELISVFRDKEHLLIEPVSEWYQEIESTYKKNNVKFRLVQCAASNIDGRMNMETKAVLPGKAVSHANLTNETVGLNIRTVDVRKVDTLVAEHKLAAPYLLKIDVDGHEESIIEGAENTLASCSVVIVEAHPRDMLDRAKKVIKAGFELFDIVDPCYYGGRLAQVDLIFLSEQIIHERGLGLYKDGFDIARWSVYQ